MDIIRRIAAVGVIIYAFMPSMGFASPEEGKTGLFGEMGWRHDPGAFVVEAGVATHLTRHLSARGAFIFFAEENLDHTYGGISGGLRWNFGKDVSPFIGAGFFYGSDEDEQLADNDGVDNDGDGWTDEQGETKDVVTDSMFTVYPEAGLHLWITDNIRITGSVKYYETTKSSTHDFWMGTGGITLFYE